MNGKKMNKFKKSKNFYKKNKKNVDLLNLWQKKNLRKKKNIRLAT